MGTYNMKATQIKTYLENEYGEYNRKNKELLSSI